jgi:4,5-dihydroxyphthalate decarboxylase
LAALTLSAALSKNAMTAPLLDGRVRPEGIELHASGVHPSEMFWRQLRFGDFDVSEMSLSSLFIATAQGRRDWVALPLFTTRRFFHTRIVVRADAGIDTPADLAGRRVGVPEYQQTAAVWTRAALQHEFGVLPRDLEWFMERPLSRSHGGVTGFTPPEGVELSFIDERTSLGTMLATAELDAAIHYTADHNLVDRTRAQAADVPGLTTLFPDPVAEGVRYYRKTGILPVNHCVVIRRDLLDRHPWLSLNLYAAFLRAKETALESARAALQPWEQLGALDGERAREVDPLPYGLRDQRHVLDAIAGFLLEQGLTTRRVALEEVFDERGLEL